MSTAKLSKQDAWKLFQEGNGPQDLIGQGVARSTAYSWYKYWLESRERSESKGEMDEGERTALLFTFK